MEVDKRRIRILNDGKPGKGPIAYWMSRDQRVNDNWALSYSQELGNKYSRNVICIFCLTENFLKASQTHYAFMLKGLELLSEDLKELNIPFYLKLGKPERSILKIINNINVSYLVTDFDPLKPKRKWKNYIKKNIKIPFYEVDTHNIVPCWIASKKQEYAAYTIRPKINKLKDEFLKDFPALRKQGKVDIDEIDWDNIYSKLNINKSLIDNFWLKPGRKNANKLLEIFLDRKIKNYNNLRNDPSRNFQSNLSPYLHFGQISAQRIAMEVLKIEPDKNTDSFLEELIIRRELSDNFCFYNKNYDNFQGFPDWAKKTLKEHWEDKRDYTYSLNSLENAKTHDNAWNAAQNEMKAKGKMHGYMRMYWAKKILEWTNNPEEALNYTLYLNNKYELDGRDPNGYAGIAWSIGGVHDRAWKERKIFGKIRYMSYNGLKAKFNIQKYIESFVKSN